ncbi:MAG: lysine--tRNA ligase [Microgenomates group bacterium]
MAQPLQELRKIRLEKLKKIKELGINPYPPSCKRDQLISQAREMLGEKVAVTGRIMAIRTHGGIAFFDLYDETGKIQLVFKKDKLSEKLLKLLELLDEGDFLAAQGEVFKTKAGEISILVEDFQILAKSLRPLPQKWEGLKDLEVRHRKRYLDLLINPSVREIFILKSKIIFAVREFLNKKGFIEVETPILQPIAGGATARPFVTHMEDIHQDFYLRIAPELYLKRVLVGGYEKVYELGKVFRNEGFSSKHNPEYTLLEIYQAYADYLKIMDLAKELIIFLLKKTKKTLKIKFAGQEIDFKNGWRKIPMRNVFLEKTGLDINKVEIKELKEYAKKKKIFLENATTKGKIIDKIFSAEIEPTLIQPTFIYDLPRDISPLAKDCPNKPGYVERFELYIGGFEVANAYSELNDPLDQKERFIEQFKEREKGDKEAHPYDADFIEALEYGMPPAGGIGFGIDRLLLILGDLPNIREVILFPILKEKND